MTFFVAVMNIQTFVVNQDKFLTQIDLTFVIGNAVLKHYPIIYSSESFSRATEYTKPEVLHRSCTCEFLWGSLTSKDTQKQIIGTIDAKTSLQTEIVIYKKNS